MPTKAYPPRTEKNIVESDCTVIISIDAKLSRGSLLTLNKAQEHKKPVLQISKANLNPGKSLVSFIEQNQIRVLNVAGRRASSDLRTYEFVKSVWKKCGVNYPVDLLRRRERSSKESVRSLPGE
jgi:hypothetical protein